MPSSFLDVVGEISTSSRYLISGKSVLSSTTLGEDVVASSLTSLGNLTSLSVGGDIQQTTGTVSLVSVTASTLSCSGLLNGNFMGDTSVTSIGTLTNGLNIAGGQGYRVGNANVLTSDTLGAGVLSSSLTSVGNLASLKVVGRLQQLPGTTANLQATSVASLTTAGPMTISSGNLNTDSNALRVATANVGVCNASPSFPLDVTGCINSSVYRINGASVLESNTLGSSVVTSSLTSLGTLSSLNIQANTAGALLNVRHTGNTSVLTTLAAHAPNNTSEGNITFISLGVSSTTNNSGEFRYVHNGTGSTLNRLDMGFSGVTTPVLTVQASGNVGVGTTSPSEALDVMGNIKFNNIIFGPTSLPSLTSSMIGYTAIYPRATSTSLSTSLTAINTTTFTLPAGVWNIYLHAALEATATGDIKNVWLSYNTSPTASLSVSVTGYREIRLAPQITVTYGTTSTYPHFSNNFIFQTTADTPSFAGYTKIRHTGTFNLTTDSYIQVTRLA